MNFADERSPEELKHLYSLMLRLTHELAESLGERFEDLRRRFPSPPDDTLPSQNREAECPTAGNGKEQLASAV
jgi:hypothetical protein